MKKLFIILLFVSFPVTAFAHQPLIEKGINLSKGEELNLNSAQELKDPTLQSLAIYGSLERPNEIDLYSFKSSKDETIPLEVLVPVRVSNTAFKPSFVLFESGSRTSEIELPFIIPENYNVRIVHSPEDREIFFEPFSMEELYHGNEVQVNIKKDVTYYIAIYEPTGYVGDYSLGMGTIENFSDVSFLDLISDVFKIKMALVGGREIPWIDLLGLFLFIAGLIIGLGAVTVIDLHGFLGRRSEYWSEATIRAHKVTKPLIWLGTLLATIGGVIYYRLSGFSSTATYHFTLLIILILNGLYLSFRVSPYLLKLEKSSKKSKLLSKNWQRKITTSFIISFIGWWTAVFLLVWHLLVAR